ncbi:hypothetical protein ACT3CE_18465 [Marinifilum sp. RC60d5]|uniref:hypothetical protein n=1 Tax=Marinifilum sp. RC60d5 TaxID=3458414 RepID=UPI0040352F3B
MRIINILLLCICTLTVSAQYNGKINIHANQYSDYANKIQPGTPRIDYYNTWTERGAKVVPMYEIYLSALAISRYGNYPKTEINSHLLLFPFAPNLGFKHQWIGKKTILSSQHTFYYPTPGLKWMRKSSFQNQLPKSAKIPHIFTFRNEIIVSRILNPEAPDCIIRIPDLILSARFGIDFSLKTGDQEMPVLDYYFLYQRTASFYSGNKLYFTGLELAGNMYKNFNFSINADYYNINFNGEWAVENQAKIHWHKNSRFSLSAGYKLSYLDSNYGTQFVITPLIDFVYKFHHRTRLQSGLFKN